MEPTNKEWKGKLVFEFISIVFAVFLGLMLNQCSDNYNNKKTAKKSLANILVEIKDNKGKVEKMLEKHKKVLENIDRFLAEMDSGREPDGANLDMDFVLITSTAWETAKLTQAIAHMDIGLVSDIAGTYGYQEYYEAVVKHFVLENSMEMKLDAHDDDIVKIKRVVQNVRSFLKRSVIPLETDLLDAYNELHITILKGG
ncbi:MAG: hypothetical protein QM786_01925 [Breznakibacter sp.]